MNRNCKDPILYHWRCERSRARAEAREARCLQLLLAASGGFFLASVAFALICRAMGVA